MAQVGPSTNNRVAKASSGANGSSAHHPSAKKRTTARPEDGSDAARQHKKPKTDVRRIAVGLHIAREPGTAELVLTFPCSDNENVIIPWWQARAELHLLMR